MNKTFFKKCIACLLLILAVAAGIAIPSSAYSPQSSKLFSAFASEGGSLQGYVDNVVAPEAGTSNSDWLYISIKRHDSSVNGDKYLSYLNTFVASNGSSLPHIQKERVALAFAVSGVDNDFVYSVLEEKVSENINDVIFGLILLDCAGYESKTNTRRSLIDYILAHQLSDSNGNMQGWALEGFSSSDIDITAMTLQALAPYNNEADVAAAIDKALAFLSSRQTEDGDYKGMGRPPMPTCESTAQVIIALTSLGIDPVSDGRFIKNGHTLYDALGQYQTSDGTYCHVKGGVKNAIATYQAACALTAAERFSAGKTSFYKFRTSGGTQVEPPVVTPPENTEEDSSSLPPENSSLSTEETSSDSSDSSESSYADSSSDTSVASSSAESYSSDDSSSALENEAASKGISYKYYVCGGIVLMFAFACVYLRVRQQATLKNIIPIAIGAIMLICGTLFFNFTSVKDYYNVNLDSASDGDSAVTISISCRVLEGAAEDYPEDGYILRPTHYVIKDGDTVFDALLAVTRANQIKISYTGSGGLISVYVSSIGGYTEMQYGALSGWIYRVNKVTPDVGCGSYDIKDGDVIEWVYTLDLGKDAETDD
ncbi:MAG: DUF4430 domain-containing protein [Clostridia bacterium]|nr:DUF4430 domain-containing protein [Clostridia bacterium]